MKTHKKISRIRIQVRVTACAAVLIVGSMQFLCGFFIT